MKYKIVNRESIKSGSVSIADAVLSAALIEKSAKDFPVLNTNVSSDFAVKITLSNKKHSDVLKALADR
jgi:hypothetical protein